MIRTLIIPGNLFSEKITLRVDQDMAEKLKDQTFTEAIIYLLDHYIIFPPKLIQFVDDLITKSKSLGYNCKEEFFYEAAIWRIKALNEHIENLEISKTLYSQAETAIKEMDLPYTSVNDFVEEQLKKLYEQHTQWKEQREIGENESTQ